MKSTSPAPSYATQYIADLQQRIPVVGDKALVDLVNGLEVSHDVIRYREGRSFLRQLVDKLNGKDDKLQSLIDNNFVAGQATLHQWVLELCDSVRISQVALQATQASLLETRSAIRRQYERLQVQAGKLQALDQRLEQLSSQLYDRFDQVEQRIHQIELRMAARDDFDQIVAAWAAGQTYQKLPWALQIPLLVREVFSSSVITYELQSKDTQFFRSLLINRVIETSKQMPTKFFGLEDLLEQSWQELSEPDQGLIAGLLEVRSIPQHRLRHMPYLFTIGTTLELATLPADTKPIKSAKCAIALRRSQFDDIPGITDTRRFVSQLIQEIADDHLTILAGNKVL